MDDRDPDQDEEEVGPRGERPQQTAAAGEASASAGTDLATGHDDACVAPSAASSSTTTQPQPDTTTPTHADAKEGHEHESDQHGAPTGHHHLHHSSSTTQPAAPPAVAPAGATTGCSPADVPTAAPPHFVAPSSYLRPLSRDPFARSPSASGPPPSTSGQQKKVQMVTPVDREQIEGLVSCAFPQAKCLRRRCG